MDNKNAGHEDLTLIPDESVVPFPITRWGMAYGTNYDIVYIQTDGYSASEQSG